MADVDIINRNSLLVVFVFFWGGFLFFRDLSYNWTAADKFLLSLLPGQFSFLLLDLFLFFTFSFYSWPHLMKLWKPKRKAIICLKQENILMPLNVIQKLFHFVHQTKQISWQHSIKIELQRLTSWYGWQLIFLFLFNRILSLWHDIHSIY